MTNTKSLFSSNILILYNFFKSASFSLFFVALLCSCSQAPVPTSHPYSTLRAMQSVAHWDLLAQDVASQLCQGVARGEIADTALYLEPGSGTFHESFHQLLLVQLTTLHNQGLCPAVTDTPQGAAQVQLRAQLVRHREDRFQRPPPGVITMLGVGVQVARDISEDMIIPFAALLDLAVGAWGNLPHHEVLLSTTVRQDGQYVFARSDLYYINDADAWHYRASPAGGAEQSRPFPVRGEDKP